MVTWTPYTRDRCPWCGRRGNGGIVHDDIGYPICIEGDYSCLQNVLNLNIQTLEEFRARQLMAILPTSLIPIHEIYSCIAKFLADPPQKPRIERIHEEWTRAGWQFASPDKKTQLEEVRRRIRREHRQRERTRVREQERRIFRRWIQMPERTGVHAHTVTY